MLFWQFSIVMFVPFAFGWNQQVWRGDSVDVKFRYRDFVLWVVFVGKVMLIVGGVVSTVRV